VLILLGFRHVESLTSRPDAVKATLTNCASNSIELGILSPLDSDRIARGQGDRFDANEIGARLAEEDS
jgi:hypothetical protein